MRSFRIERPVGWPKQQRANEALLLCELDAVDDNGVPNVCDTSSGDDVVLGERPTQLGPQNRSFGISANIAVLLRQSDPLDSIYPANCLHVDTGVVAIGANVA